MFKRGILVLGLSILGLAQIHSGTLFENDKRTSDPYIAEFGGFRSIFINPAGISGQNGFDLAVNIGVEGSMTELDTIVATMSLSTAYCDYDYQDHNYDYQDHNYDYDKESYDTNEQKQLAAVFEHTARLITNQKIDERVILEAVFGDVANNRKGKSSNSNILKLLYGDDNSLDVDLNDEDAVRKIIAQIKTEDYDRIKTNLDNIRTGANSRFYQGIPHQMSAKVLGTIRAGFLHNGFGLGLYNHMMGTVILDPNKQEQSLDSVFYEFGAIVGYGFTLPETSISLGVSGNFGTLIKNEHSVSLYEIEGLFDRGLRYGYIWGIDAGVVWQPMPELRFGIVFNDIIGSNQMDTPYYAEGLNELFNNEDLIAEAEHEYKFSLDMDIGATLLAEKGKMKSQFSLDFYDFIGFLREVESNNDSFQDAMYRALGHVRLGAKLTLFKVLKLAAQYHNNYVGFGMGLDIAFFELFCEAKIHDSVDQHRYDEDIPIAMDIMARVYF